jgi:hypothetical protein
MSSRESWETTVWFARLERADGSLVGAVVAVDGADGFIEGAANESVPGAAEALQGLRQPAGGDARTWMTAAAGAMSDAFRLGAPTKASSVAGFEHATAREVLHWYLDRHGVEASTAIVGSLDSGIVGWGREGEFPLEGQRQRGR